MARSMRAAASAGSVPHQVGHVLQREPDAVEALDDPVVEVLADPGPLVDDGQALDLLVQTGILDGDAGVKREHLRQALVGFGELRGIPLVREIEVADRPTPNPDGHAEERRHRRVVGAGSRTSACAPRSPGSGRSGSRGRSGRAGHARAASGPIASRCSRLMPLVTKRSITPYSSMIPMRRVLRRR